MQELHRRIGDLAISHFCGFLSDTLKAPENNCVMFWPASTTTGYAVNLVGLSHPGPKVLALPCLGYLKRDCGGAGKGRRCCHTDPLRSRFFPLDFSTCVHESWTHPHHPWANEARGSVFVEVLVMVRSRCEVFHLVNQSESIGRSIPEARTIELEQEVMNQDIINWTPPPLEMMNTMLKPYYCLFKVDSIGLERIPNTFPCFYVMNHSLYGLEMPALVHLLYSKKGVFVRGLADHSHWMGPHGPLLRQCGAVDGSRPNVDLLMANKQSPGSTPVHGFGFIRGLVGLMVHSLKKRWSSKSQDVTYPYLSQDWRKFMWLEPGCTVATQGEVSQSLLVSSQ